MFSSIVALSSLFSLAVFTDGEPTVTQRLTDGGRCYFRFVAVG